MTALDTPTPAREQTVGRPLAVVLGLLTIFGPISMDLYLPVLPALTAELQSTTSVAQLTITACLLGLAIGQVVAGPALGPPRPADAAADRGHRLHADLRPLRGEPHRRDTHPGTVRPGPGRRRRHSDRAGGRPRRLLGRQTAPLLRPPHCARRPGRHYRTRHRRAARNGHGLAWSLPVPCGRRNGHPGGLPGGLPGDPAGRPARHRGLLPHPQRLPPPPRRPRVRRSRADHRLQLRRDLRLPERGNVHTPGHVRPVPAGLLIGVRAELVGLYDLRVRRRPPV